MIKGEKDANSTSILTAVDALVCRLSAMKMGYIKSTSSTSHSVPVINLTEYSSSKYTTPEMTIRESSTEEDAEEETNTSTTSTNTNSTLSKSSSSTTTITEQSSNLSLNVQIVTQPVSHRPSSATFLRSPRKSITESIDPLSELLYTKLTRKPTDSIPKKSPIINRGTYTRYQTIDMIVHHFISPFLTNPVINTINKSSLSLPTTCQVICLGSGYDTLGYRIQQQYNLSNLSDQHHGLVQIFEVDFPEVTQSKHSILSQFLGNKLNCSISGDLSPSYVRSRSSSEEKQNIGSLHLIGCNLCDHSLLTTRLQEEGFNRLLPTLILTECVLVYLEKIQTEQLVSVLSDFCEDAVWLSYDMINPDDIYGRTMVKNIMHAGYHIPGLLAYPTLESQRNRFLSCGWKEVHCCTMLQAYHQLIPEEEHQRISKLEIFDEVEEWNMLMSHYSLSLAIKVQSTLSETIGKFFHPSKS